MIGKCLRRGNFKGETESLLIATQNTVIKTNCVKAKIYTELENSMYRLRLERDGTVNFIINQSNRQAQEIHKQAWMGEKVIYWELRKKLKFDHADIIYTNQTLFWEIKCFVDVWYFDHRPGQKCHSEWCTGRKWHILMAVMRGNRVCGNWLMKWDEVNKFPWYTHRLMHRKRVTCELHDSYFRLMTIQHAIPKIEWATEWAWTTI